MTVEIANLRATIERLTTFERPSASEGERAAAEWIADRLREQGWHPQIEVERAHGGYWLPLGLLTGAAGAAGLAAGRWPRLRRPAALVGALAALGIADDVSGGPHALRRVLPQRETFNVVAQAGDPDAERTLVFVAHHDAAHGGLIFDERGIRLIADRFPDWYESRNTSPQVMAIVAGGPALMALGALTGSAIARRLGTFLSLGSAAAFADIAGRSVVPGANDNLTAVAAILELGRLLAERPVRGVRVLLVSTGSEESFMEGMRGFVRRHAAELPRETTRVVALDSVGSPELILIEGEGMLAMRDYDPELRDFIARCAAEIETPLRRGLRLGLATDALIALRAGYPAACLGSVTKYKFPANYHKQSDTAANVDYETVAAATRVIEAVARASGS